MTEHNDGVSPLTMIGRPRARRVQVDPDNPAVRQHSLEIGIWVDGKRTEHAVLGVKDTSGALVFDPTGVTVQTLRAMADQIEHGELR